MNQYALYLRKSRADLDAEARGEGETLAKHRAALTALAKRRDLFVAREYAEIVSGDTIAARPQMQQLLEDVKAGLYAGVIVNDVDRLGRGDSIDQEIIKYTFASSRTLIITPNRDIDPANPTDDDMLDFSMFMARFEYKKISQRLQQGRIRTVMAGGYVSGNAPYGYTSKRENGQARLVPCEAEADVVPMVFAWYIDDRMPLSSIAKRLNDAGIRCRRGAFWTYTTVKNMLRNRAYVGDTVWGKQRTVKVVGLNGQRQSKLKPGDSPMIVEGTHPALISRERFDQAQRLLSVKAPATCAEKRLRNPLAGLVYCAECGRAMMTFKGTHGALILRCATYGCQTVSRPLHHVEAAVLDVLDGWCADYRAPGQQPDRRAEDVAALNRQLATISQQLTRAQELVELGVYSPSEFVQRREALGKQRDSVLAGLELIEKRADRPVNAPMVRSVLDAYPSAQSVDERNDLLKSVIRRIVYSRPSQADLPVLDVFPRADAII